jgi:hypothetical protein
MPKTKGAYMSVDEIWKELEGTRIHTKSFGCLRCGGQDGVMLRHACKDELEFTATGANAGPGTE